MTRLLVLALFFTALSGSAWPRPESTPMGVIDTRNGRVVLDDKVIVEVKEQDGSTNPIGMQPLFFIGRDRPNFHIFTYSTWDGRLNQDHFFIVDLAGGRVTVSNDIALPSDYRWPDNNYVIAKGDKVYFGFYEPERVQFVYEAGRITPNPGKWMGPRKPVEHFPMKSRDPCFNIPDIEECRAEQARRKQRRANKRQ